MYGLPLTIYFLARYVGLDVAWTEGGTWARLFGTPMAHIVAMVIGYAIVFSGATLVADGSRRVHQARREKRLVTDGVYARARHQPGTSGASLSIRRIEYRRSVMHHIARLGFIVLAVPAFGVAPAFAQGAVVKGKKADMEFRSETRVGSTLLPPGRYQFQRESVDGEHDLVVRTPSRNEVAHVPCRLEAPPASGPIRETALHTKPDADGIERVTQIRIRGETEGHVVAVAPEA
jgi:hypothetical protein